MRAVFTGLPESGAAPRQRPGQAAGAERAGRAEMGGMAAGPGARAAPAPGESRERAGAWSGSGGGGGGQGPSLGTGTGDRSL